MNHFAVHWSAVDHASAAAPEGLQLFALWPSPVNGDECFRDAGFTEFGDSDALWEATAEVLLSRLLIVLEGYGEPRLVSEPLLPRPPWYRLDLGEPPPLPLREQIALPMYDDSLPDALVAFGNSGVTLRTGCGHHLFWIAWPLADAPAFPQLAADLAEPYAAHRTRLKWVCLL
jgi:hypothetical protein